MQQKKPQVALKLHLDKLSKSVVKKEDFAKLNDDIARLEEKFDFLFATMHGSITVDHYNRKWSEKMEADKVQAKLVVIESPFAGEDDLAIERNIRYCRECVMDCLRRGESPYASHIFFTQEGMLDDTVPEERKLGIESGFRWGQQAEKTVVYTDIGMSNGMSDGIRESHRRGRPVEYRSLPGWDLFTSNQELDKIRAERHKLNTAIKQGMEDVKAGRTRPAKEAIKEIMKNRKIKKDDATNSE